MFKWLSLYAISFIYILLTSDLLVASPASPNDCQNENETSLISISLPSCNSGEVLSDEDFLLYCAQNPEKLYQDILIGGTTCFQGINICDIRYDVLRSIFGTFPNYFSVLDLGAAQGYFSIRAALEFPKSEVVMIEAKNSSELKFGHHEDLLFQICKQNSPLPNVVYLNKRISLSMLKRLNVKEHFDVVLAMLVVHQIDSSMDVRRQLLEELLKLGDYIVLEVSNDAAKVFRNFVRDEFKSDSHECRFLGEVQRCYSPETAYGGYYPKGKGEFYLFTRRGMELPRDHVHPQKIKRSTYREFHGIFPESRPHTTAGERTEPADVKT